MKVERTGYKRFEAVELTKKAYEQQREDFFEEFLEPLPTWSELQKLGEPRDLRVLTKEMVVTTTRSNSRFTQIKFKVGFITDLASVPRIFRSVVDNDETRMIEAVLFHDYGFTTHYISFKEVNKLFLNMLRYAKCNRFRRMVAYIAVASPFAKMCWNRNTRRQEWTKRTTEFLEARENYNGLSKV